MARAKKAHNMQEKPVWLKYTEEEVKSIILKLAEKGNTAEKIGLILRDQYGIPKVKLYNLKIKKVLDEKGKFIEPTTKNLSEKLEKISLHSKIHKKDQPAKRSVGITSAKLKTMREYQAKKNKQ